MRLEVSTDRALNDVKDAVTKHPVRPAPHHRGADQIERIDVVGQAIQTYRRLALPAMTPEQLSWFIDDTVLRALQGVAGRRQGGADRRRDPRDPGGNLAPGPAWPRWASPPGQVNAQLRATNVELAGGRGEVGGQGAGDPHPGQCRQRGKRLADTRIVLPDATARSACPTWPP